MASSHQNNLLNYTLYTIYQTFVLSRSGMGTKKKSALVILAPRGALLAGVQHHISSSVCNKVLCTTAVSWRSVTVCVCVAVAMLTCCWQTVSEYFLALDGLSIIWPWNQMFSGVMELGINVQHSRTTNKLRNTLSSMR